LSAAESFEISIPDQTFDDLRERLARTRWAAQPRQGWELGVQTDYLRELCRHWAGDYDPGRLPGLLNRFGNLRWRGLHTIHEPGSGRLPLLLLHGWPGGPIEYLDLIPRLVEAGHEVAVPSMPGYGWSEDPGEPLNIAAVASRLRELAEEGLGWERYGIVGGDWGAPIAARMAFDAPQRAAALYVFTPGTLPPSAQLAEPPLDEAERAFIEEGLRWRRRKGHHMLIQSTVPDIVSTGLNDSPAGLAAYLVEKYRSWSDCGGDVERRFSKDELCDYLTMYWATGTIASSMRLYWGERADRWRPAEGETVDVPAAAGVFPAEIVNPPRQWTARLLTDLRRWTELPRGGHFAAHEEPELLADELLTFLAELENYR
jgi:pimeloyl-ACP methyl ester carboxylesterase